MKTYFAGAQTSSILGVWTAPGAPETTPKGGARSAPRFGVVYGAPGAVQIPKIYDFWVAETQVFVITLTRSWGYTGTLQRCCETIRLAPAHQSSIRFVCGAPDPSTRKDPSGAPDLGSIGNLHVRGRADS